jgi:preprotein translocase subunit SecA
MENEMPQDPDPKHVKPTGVTQARLAQIDRLAPTMEKLSDAELQRKTLELKDRLGSGKATALDHRRLSPLF